jgi:hypothetical protein
VLGEKTLKLIAGILSYTDTPHMIAALIYCDGFPYECLRVKEAVEAYERLYRTLTLRIVA